MTYVVQPVERLVSERVCSGGVCGRRLPKLLAASDSSRRWRGSYASSVWRTDAIASIKALRASTNSFGLEAEAHPLSAGFNGALKFSIGQSPQRGLVPFLPIAP